MDSFTLAVIVGIIAVLAMFVGLTVIDKGTPSSAKSREKPE